jgi:hypothetical protein
MPADADQAGVARLHRVPGRLGEFGLAACHVVLPGFTGQDHHQ